MREVSHDSVFLSICSISRQMSSADIIKIIFYLPIILFACVLGSPIPIPYQWFVFQWQGGATFSEACSFSSPIWSLAENTFAPDTYFWLLSMQTEVWGFFSPRYFMSYSIWLNDPQLCFWFILIYHFIWVLIGYNSKIAIISHITQESY